MYLLLPNRLRRVLAILLLSATSVVVACSGSGSDSSDSDSESGNPVSSVPRLIPEPTFTFLQQEVFNSSCALSGCHTGSRRPDLRTDNSFASILNVASSRGIPYITPGDPGNSYLYIKVAGSTGISGGLMPRGRSALSSSVLEAMREWIESGALNN